MVPPHVYDPTARRQRLNPDFLKLYPDKVKEFFSEEELVRDGYDKLPKQIQKNNARRDKAREQAKEDIIYAGSSKTAVEGFLNDTGGSEPNPK